MQLLYYTRTYKNIREMEYILPTDDGAVHHFSLSECL